MNVKTAPPVFLHFDDGEMAAIDVGARETEDMKANRVHYCALQPLKVAPATAS